VQRIAVRNPHKIMSEGVSEARQPRPPCSSGGHLYINCQIRDLFLRALATHLVCPSIVVHSLGEESAAHTILVDQLSLHCHSSPAKYECRATLISWAPLVSIGDAVNIS
jgi:hypothetical protein